MGLISRVSSRTYRIMENNDRQKLNDKLFSSDIEPSGKLPYREQDIYLPLNNIATIMRKAVPSNGKVAKEAKECVQECASEFISFITSEAAERCAQEKRKTVNGEDILHAMQTLGFDDYLKPLTEYLNMCRRAQTPKKNGENEMNDESLEDEDDE